VPSLCDSSPAWLALGFAQQLVTGLVPLIVGSGENASVVWLPAGTDRSRSALIGQKGTLPVEPAPGRGLTAGSFGRSICR
jgi:hypothetical protein